MSRAAAKLADSISYQRLVLALRFAHLLCDQGTRERAETVRVESNVLTGWEDIVETWRSVDQLEVRGWQVKRQVSPMTKDRAARLFVTLGESALKHATLALSHPSRVSNVGEFAHLDNLTRRLRELPPEERRLQKGERRWLAFAKESAGLDDLAIERVLACLHVRFIGDEEQVRDRLRTTFAALYRPPWDGLAGALERFACDVGDGYVVRASELELEVLAAFEHQRDARMPTYARDRRRYVDEVARALDERLVAKWNCPDLVDTQRSPR